MTFIIKTYTSNIRKESTAISHFSLLLYTSPIIPMVVMSIVPIAGTINLGVIFSSKGPFVYTISYSASMNILNTLLLLVGLLIARFLAVRSIQNSKMGSFDDRRRLITKTIDFAK